MRKWEVGRYTLSQLINALERPDDDPHAGGEEIASTAELEEMYEL